MLKKTDKYIWFILILALILRFIGLNHGFPFIFHPDEPTIVRSALQIRFGPNPAHFDWPHLYIYLNYFLYMVFAKIRYFITVFGYKQQVQSILPIVWNEELIYYFLTRAMSAILGALTIIPVFLTGKSIFGKKAGIISALILAITPFHVWHSHYSLADIPMMFFLAWSLYYSSQVLFKKDLKNYILSGLFVGLATSTKYNGLLIAVALVFAHIIRILSEKEEKIIKLSSLKGLVLAGITSIVAFLAGSPFVLIDYKTFLRKDSAKGALWQFTNVGSTDFITHLKQFVSITTNKLPENFGYTIFILFILSLIYVIVRIVRNKKFWLNRDLLFFSLIGISLIYYVSGLDKTRAHYFFICYPAVIVGGVGFLSQQLEIVKSKYKNIIWSPVIAIPLYMSFTYSLMFYKQDTRLDLYHWALSNKLNISRVFINDTKLKPIFEKTEIKSNFSSNIPKNMPLGTYFVGSDYTIESNVFKKVLDVDGSNRRGPSLVVYSH